MLTCGHRGIVEALYMQPEELKLCLYNIIDVCSETTSLHVHSFNSILNTSLHAYTQLQFLTEHNSAQSGKNGLVHETS